MANKTVTVKSADGDYSSLNAALAGESANLVANTCILTIELYNFQDTTVWTTGTGYTTSASYYINITCPVGQRHNGKWSTSGYRTVAGNDWGYVGTISAANTRCNWFQLTNTATDHGHGLYCNAAGCTIGRFILKGNGTAGCNGIYVNAASRADNGIIYDFGGIGVLGGDWVSANVNNCTVVDCGTGFQISGDGIPENVLCYSCTTDFSTGGVDCTTCASSDGTADDGGGSGNIVNIADPFMDFAGDDFHVDPDNTEIRGKGTDLSASFTDDIDGETRPTGANTWDIGADQYVAVGTTATPTTLAPTTISTTSAPTTLLPTTLPPSFSAFWARREQRIIGGGLI